MTDTLDTLDDGVLEFRSTEGDKPTFFVVTELPADEVEAVLVDPAGDRHDLAEFEESNGETFGRRVGVRLPPLEVGVAHVEWSTGEVYRIITSERPAT